MSLFPFNTNWTRRAQTDSDGVFNTLGAGVVYTPGSPALDDVDAYFTGDMAVGAYALLATAPDVGARNVTVTQTAVDAEDTNGTIVVVGTAIDGSAITETLTPNAGATVAGAVAFASITSITGVGWVTGGGADTIEIGFGALIGLPDCLTDTAQVLAASLNNVRQATFPTVTVSASDVSLNTVDLDSALNGTPVKVYYVV